MKKVSINISGHQTSFSLEPIFFDYLQLVAKSKGISVNQLVKEIDEKREIDQNLSSNIRVYLFKHLNELRKNG